MDSEHPGFDDATAPLDPELDAMVWREFEIFQTEAQDAIVEFETGEIDWESGPRGLFRFVISITDLGVLGRQFLEAARDFSAENYAIAVAKLPKPRS